MITRAIGQAIDQVSALDELGSSLKSAIHNAVLKGGKPTRKLADLLHGTWLGHPLHPVLTDFTIGAWGIGAMFDAVAVATGDKRSRKIGNTLARVGTVAAVPTAITGLIDYSTVKKPATSAATLHALMNDVNIGLYLVSLRERKRGNYARGVAWSMAAVGLTFASAWIGGYLVYGHKVGVNHSEASGPEEWTPVLAAADLPDNTPKRVTVDDNDILLYRLNGEVMAVDAVCSHAGGPLDEGSFDGCFVQCPWHDSVFDLRDGRVKHGPATIPQPAYAVRERDGQLEVRLSTT